MPLACGDLIGDRYRLDRVIGEGGMGVIWSGTHRLTGKHVALKVAKGDADERARRRLLREARAACAVRHPAVVPIDDVIELDDASIVLVMDLLEGESLRDHLARHGRLSIQQCARLLLPVVGAVAAAHEQGVVHRDLKPANVFLVRTEADPVVRVLDFGIAKLDHRRLSSAGDDSSTGIAGTPDYMAPEQIFGDENLDRAVDVWALGVILYEALSGKRPTADAKNVGQVMKIITTASFPPLARAAPNVPPEIATIVDAMLVRDRKRRLSDLGELRRALEPFATQAAPISPAALEVESSPPSSTLTHRAPQITLREPKARSWPLFLGVGVVLAATAAAYPLLRKTEDAHPLAPSAIASSAPPIVLPSITFVASASAAPSSPPPSIPSAPAATAIPARYAGGRAIDPNPTLPPAPSSGSIWGGNAMSGGMAQGSLCRGCTTLPYTNDALHEGGVINAKIVACLAASRYEAPKHDERYYFVEVDPHGNVGRVLLNPEFASHPRLDACVAQALATGRVPMTEPGGGWLELQFSTRSR